jgi:hypothetical protein
MILDIMQLLITLMFTLVGSADSGVGFPPFYYGCRVFAWEEDHANCQSLGISILHGFYIGKFYCEVIKIIILFGSSHNSKSNPLANEDYGFVCSSFLENGCIVILV